MADRPSRLVYSTASGRTCARCGWPQEQCRCAAAGGQDEAIPATIVARLRIETKGRGGKTVTVIDGLPRNAAFLSDLGRELKKACATGGAVREDGIELQGDRREAVRRVLAGRGHRVRG